MRRLGVTRLYAKALAENDNSKQQIYLGGSFDVLQQLPITNLREEPGGKRPNFKASLDLRWVAADGRTERAESAQLILYPDYPEVRLSGFLRGCSLAPSEHMRAVPAPSRRFNNQQDGRILFFGVSADGTTHVCLELEEAPLRGNSPRDVEQGNWSEAASSGSSLLLARARTDKSCWMPFSRYIWADGTKAAA